MQPTITIDEANRRVEEYVARAVKALPPEAELRLGYEERSGDCSDPTDHGPKNRVVANRDYNVLGLQPEKIPTYFDALRTWWLANNFRILNDTPPNEFLWVENNTDGFQMTLQANSKGELFLIAGSPCVWPNGTPEPEALGNTPDTGTAVAQDRPTPPTIQPTTPQTQQKKPRPRRAPVDDEDFDQTDWTDDNHT
ncbi:hypothetical protein ABZ863_16790 [Saccharomonospora sp. NPDC046836]|uniref:hypothetical protein n=1 Tax=Saccharomonospora sp. NPDC046836 TaxID=3156921 RepID=UPI0033DB6219